MMERNSQKSEQQSRAIASKPRDAAIVLQSHSQDAKNISIANIYRVYF